MSVSIRATSISHKPLDGVIAVSELGDIRMVGATSDNAEVFGTLSLLVLKND